MSDIKLFFSSSNDPFFNLALEEELFEQKEDEDFISVLLWVNRPCVIMGRFQNPWREVNMELLSQSGISLVRRRSGGGTVVHDFGNLCFSFLFPYRFFSKEKQGEFLLRVGEALGVSDLTLSPRLDLLWRGQKVSGQAYLQKQKRSLHHGTFLLQSDLIRLEGLLSSPFHDAIVGADIRSKRSLVANLGHSVASLQKAISSVLSAPFSSLVFDEKRVLEKMALLTEEKWVLGETPVFNYLFPYGKMEVKKGLLVSIEWNFENSVLHPSALELLGQQLKGTAFGKQTICDRLDVLIKEWGIYEEELKELKQTIF